jgi:hypothetical protein
LKKYIFILILSFSSIFQVKSHVQINYPEGGEIFSAGDIVIIEWEILIEHNTQNWDLYFSSDGGQTWEILAQDISVNSLSYDWQVADVATSMARIKVVQDNDDFDYQDVSDNFTIDTTTGLELVEENNSVMIYPNPVNDYFTLQIENQENKTSSLLIYNSEGILVNSIEDIRTGKRIVDRKDLNRGIYFYKLMQDSNIISTGKIILK